MLAEKLKKLRQKKGWTQQELSHRAGLSHNAISKIEQGATKKPIMQTLIKIADALGVSFDELVGREMHG